MCNPATGVFAVTAITFNTNSLNVGTVSLGSLTLVQVRDDPLNYVSSTVTPIYGLMVSSVIMVVSFTSATSTLTVTSVI